MSQAETADDESFFHKHRKALSIIILVAAIATEVLTWLLVSQFSSVAAAHILFKFNWLGHTLNFVFIIAEAVTISIGSVMIYKSPTTKTEETKIEGHISSNPEQQFTSTGRETSKLISKHKPVTDDKTKEAEANDKTEKLDEDQEIEITYGNSIDDPNLLNGFF